ncbi:MAG: hypothetical protein IJP17_02385, partial [Clostridia bacterium]|nr:hypothetical protein [Clostridia bacterium]
MAKKQKELKRVKGKEFFNYKKRCGDRTDGWRVRSASDPTFDLIPHIMPQRCDSQVFMEEMLETEKLDSFVREMRRSGEMPQLSRLAVVMAACVRAFSRYPKTNRFIAGNKIYARNHYCISLTIKKSMSIDADEATVKIYFDPNDTLAEVNEKLCKEVGASKHDIDNETDSFVDKIKSVPQWAIRAFVRWANRKDRKKG